MNHALNLFCVQHSSQHVTFAGVDAAELDLGDNLKINLNLNRQENHDTDITYLVRGVLHLCLCAHV